MSRNFIAKNLKAFSPKVVPAKKGKGSYKRSDVDLIDNYVDNLMARNPEAVADLMAFVDSLMGEDE